MKASSPRPGFTCSGSTACWPPRAPRLFAAHVREPSLVRGRTALLGSPDAAGVRGRRSAMPLLRRPTPYRGRLPGGPRLRDLLDRLGLSQPPGLPPPQEFPDLHPGHVT